MQLRKLYDLAYGRHPYQNILSWNYLFTRKNLLWVKKYAEALSGATIADYGCGKLPYYDLFEPYTEQYLALDFHPDKDPSKRKAVYVPLNPDGGIPEGVPKADLILSFQVLPEVDSLAYYLSQVRSIATEGARVMITSPWGMTALGNNDKLRISPYAVASALKELGFEIIAYEAAGYFFAAAGLSLNLLLATKNRYDVASPKVEFSKVKVALFTPFILLINALSLILDFMLPLNRSPSNWLIVAKKAS
jgi:hypothetical protein